MLCRWFDLILLSQQTDTGAFVNSAEPDEKARNETEESISETGMKGLRWVLSIVQSNTSSKLMETRQYYDVPQV